MPGKPVPEIGASSGFGSGSSDVLLDDGQVQAGPLRLLMGGGGERLGRAWALAEMGSQAVGSVTQAIAAQGGQDCHIVGSWDDRVPELQFQQPRNLFVTGMVVAVRQHLAGNRVHLGYDNMPMLTGNARNGTGLGVLHRDNGVDIEAEFAGQACECPLEMNPVNFVLR